MTWHLELNNLSGLLFTYAPAGRARGQAVPILFAQGVVERIFIADVVKRNLSRDTTFVWGMDLVKFPQLGL